MLTRSAVTRREALLRAFAPEQLPPAPCVALRVDARAGAPDCGPAELASLLATDPALCAGVLRAANSCAYAPLRPVASVARAVQALGHRAVRAVALALVAPGPGRDAPGAGEHWLAAVGGAVIARELSVIAGHPDPDGDLAAALLRDAGTDLLRRAFPARWAAFRDERAGRLSSDPDGAEEAAFGASHADLGAELFARWGLPPEVTEPVRCHHRPEQLPPGPARGRAELLWLADRLIHLDEVAEHPAQLARVLDEAWRLCGLDAPGLAALLSAVAPKVDSFAAALQVSSAQCPDLGSTLATL